MDQPIPANSPGARVGAVIALKPTASAKSRLGSLGEPVRRRLAWTMAVDTLRAVGSVADEVVVVGDQPGVRAALRAYGIDVTTLAEPASGMNAALSHGAEHLRRLGASTVVACVGDLPALRAESLVTALSVAPSPGARSSSPAAYSSRTFVSDTSGIGTTLLIAHQATLNPHFQGRSAAAHRNSGAMALGADDLGGPLADARHDVDDETDLADAFHLGLGPTTAALFEPSTGVLGRYATITVDSLDDGGLRTAVTADGAHVLVPRHRLDPGLADVRPGQRLHAMLTRSTVLSAWL